MKLIEIRNTVSNEDEFLHPKEHEAIHLWDYKMFNDQQTLTLTTASSYLCKAYGC